MLVLALLRIVNSPFGRVLQAIRENDFRAEAIGYRTVVYRTAASVLSALFATLAGVLLALWLRYNGPDTTLSFEIMLDMLLIVVIGGMGTIYGAVIGAVLFVLAQNYLQDLMKLGAAAVQRHAGARRSCSRPTAGCCGSASCSCCRCTTSRAAWSAGCGRGARPAEAAATACRGASARPAAHIRPRATRPRRHITAPTCQGTNSFWP